MMVPFSVPLHSLLLKPTKFETHLVLWPEPNDPAENACPLSTTPGPGFSVDTYIYKYIHLVYRMIICLK